MIFWQKLANLSDVINGLNLFSVEIDKKKLQSGNTPLQTYHWSVFNRKISKIFKKLANEPKMAVKTTSSSKNADIIEFQKFRYQIKALHLLIHLVYNTS